MSDLFSPPPLPDVLADPAFRAAEPADRLRVLRQWKDDTIAYGRAAVPGWSKQHEDELTSQLPDREGLMGRLAELGSGLGDAFVNQAPADLAAVIQGRDVPLSPDTWTERLKAEQVQDRARRPHSLQTLAGEKFGEALATGPSSIVTSAVTGLGGAAIGGAAGSAVPVVGNATGALVGAGTLSGAAMYRIASNHFLTQVRDHLRESGVALTPDQWAQTKQDLDSEATKYGLWEAGPEALSQAFTAGLFNGTLGKLAGKIPGLGSATAKLASSAIAKTAAKYRGKAAKYRGKLASSAIAKTAAKYGGKLAAKAGAEIAEELTTETATQMGQGEIEARHGLSDHAPALGEALGEVAGPTIVGAILQSGAYAGARRARQFLARQPAVETPATPPAPNSSPAATPGAPISATPSAPPTAPTAPGTDLASEIGASLPDAESRDVLAGRSTEAEARKLADAKVDFGATVQSVQDALLTAGATPAQLDALDFQLRVLEERKDKRRLRPDQVNTSLANTFLFQALPPAEVFPLVSRLAADTANIQQLRAGLAALRTGATPAAAPATNVSPTPAAGLTPEQRAAKLAVLQQAEQDAAAAKAQAEATREQARLQAEADKKAQTERVRAENARLATLERTGRDETGKIADLTRVPDTEMAGLDLEREGITEAQFAAEMDRRARAEERNAATAGNRGEELLDVLAQVKLPGESATLPEELRTLIREGMTAKQRMALVRAGVGELDNVAEALRGRGFTWAKTPADVIDHVQRALRGEMIYAEGDRDDVQFARRGKPQQEPGAEIYEALIKSDENEDGAVFEGTGISAVECTGFACAIRQALGDRAKIVGFSEEENPTSKVAREAGGHDFALIDDRYIVDPWVRDVEGISQQTIFDTQSPADAKAIADLYGPRSAWNRVPGAEKLADQTKSSVPAEPRTRLARSLEEIGARRSASSDSETQFSRRPAAPDPATTAPLAARWLDNLSLVAPGVAREVELRFGDPEQLVADGSVRASDLTGEEEAATVRQSRESARSIVYLFDRALRKNTDAVTLLNLLHEIGHLFFDTLDTATRRALRDQWNTERTTRTGPLFTAEGNLRENVALGVFDEANPRQALHEWFAERLAHANDTWAKRRTDVRAQGDGILRTVAAEFRAMLLKLRELLERAFGRNGYDDQLVSDFRQFLDQGDRWNQDGPDADAELAGSFAKTGLPFARRTDANPEGREPEQLLRDYASLERTRDRYVSDGQTVPRHILTGLADLREALEESLPGWRNQAKAIAAEQTVTTAPSAEPEAGASALFPSDEGTVAPEETATKRSQLEASTLRRPTGVRDWLASLGRLFTNFRSAIPELPGGAKGRVFTAFRQGYRMMRAATEFTRKDAEEKVGHILAPLTGLGADAIAPETYRELQKLQQIRQKQIEAGKPIRPELTRRIAQLDAQLDAVPYHLFRKVALYRDLFFRSRLEAPNGEPLRLPFGLTAAEIETTLRDLHAKVKASPHAAQIEESLRRHYALVKEVRDGLLARGYVIPEELRNPLYFPHIVIDKASGSISRVKLDTAEDFRGYLVRLVGSERAIESDYLQAMYYHLATVEAHNARQDIVARYWQPYDIKADLVKQAAEMNQERQARGLGSINWRQLVPEGHVIYTVDDRIPLRPEYLINRQVLAEKLGVQLGEGDLQKQLRDLGMSVTLTADDFQAALMAGEKTQWVVPKPVADALRAILDREARTTGPAEKVLVTVQGLWKRWTLFAPQNVIRYTYGNMVADLEKLFSADPGVFRQLRPAMEEVRAFYDGEKPSADLRAAFERGVLDAVTVGEVTDLARKQLDQFAAFTTSRERFVGMLKRGLGWGVTVNRIREASFRYAKFKADLERQRAGAEPIYAGAYNRDVRAIREDTPEATHYARAAEISRKTFGDYADISVSGDGLRKYFIPFYSWMEVNFRYHANLFRNLGDMGAGAGAAQIARGTAAAASRILVARSATGVLLRLAVPYAAVALWNNSGDREDLEKTLSDEDRRRFHVILGKDAQGRTLVAYAPTALSDVMKWFGGNEFARLAGEYVRGQITFPQLAHEWISNTPGDVLNNALQGISPQIKAAMIATTRKQPFPDILNQRSIADYDLRWAVLGSTTDGLTADALRRLLDDNYYSGKSWGDWAQQNILQARRRDPEQWGFYATMDRVAAYQKAHGGTVDLGVNNKADAEMLGSFRRAIRAGDVPAALNFYQKLLDNGYTAERFRASIDHADPLATLKREVRKEFVAGLSPAEQEDLRNGYKYAARMQAFDHRERQLFPSEKATRDYRARYAAQGGRPDVFAGIMETFANRPEDQLELRAETLMRSSLRPVKR